MSDTNPLLNNFSVQGAAKSIEGILDPNTATIKPQQEATPVEPKEPEAARASASAARASRRRSRSRAPRRTRPLRHLIHLRLLHSETGFTKRERGWPLRKEGHVHSGLWLTSNSGFKIR